MQNPWILTGILKKASGESDQFESTKQNSELHSPAKAKASEIKVPNQPVGFSWNQVYLNSRLLAELADKMKNQNSESSELVRLESDAKDQLQVLSVMHRLLKEKSVDVQG